MSPETAEALRGGRELFNQRSYFEAHEVWEVAWRREEGQTRLLLQALILVAAGCHKATVHEPRGTVKLLGAALAKLTTLGDAGGGLALDELRRSVEGTLSEAERWQSGEVEAMTPSLRLTLR